MAGVQATSGEPGVERVQEHLTGALAFRCPGVTSPWAGFHVECFCLHHPRRAEVQAASGLGGGSSVAMLVGV